MKKIILVLFVILFAVPGFAEVKEYRIGIKGSVLYPSIGSDTLVKTDSMLLTLELDLKRDSRLDSGLRFGLGGFATRLPDHYACYNLYQFGYGIRYYFDERESPETSYHLFKRYVMADGLFVWGNKTKDLDSSTSAAQTLLGGAIKLGAGLEYVFGPLSSGFVDAEYLILHAKASDRSYEFPVNGIVLAFGLRIAK